MPHSEEINQLIFPDDIQIIEDVESLRVVADPLRLRILELLRREPATVKQLAKALHVPLKKLYYHVNLLEEHNLIRVSSTRVVSGIIEKQYQVTAYRISVSRELLANGGAEGDAPEGVEALLSFLLGHTESEIRKSLRAGLINPASTKLNQDGIVLGRNWLRLTPQQAQELSDQMFAVVLAFARQQAPADDPGSRYYEILEGVYPVVAPPADERQATKDAQ